MSNEVADNFVEALRTLEEDRDVGALVEIHPRLRCAWSRKG
jgi:hypothetical protein